MALSFPGSPSVGQTYAANGRTWQWDGYAWTLPAASGTASWTSLSVDGGRSLFRANSEPYAVGASYGGGGGYVYFGASHVSATPNAQISNAGGAPLMTLLTGGNVGIGTTSPGTALDVAGAVRSSTGIRFGTDTAQANTLYDYEEGAWTPSFTAGLSAVSYASQVGQYVKVGRQVIATLRISTFSSTGTSSTVAISLPFAASATSIGSGVVHFNGSAVSGIATPLAYGPDSGSAAILFTQANGSTLRGSDFNGSSFTFGVTVFYRAD